MPSRVRALRPAGAVGLAVLLFLTALSVGASSSRAAGYPVLPVGEDRWFVSNLTGAELSPGGSGRITFSVGDPIPNEALDAVTLTLQVYAFNAFPGNATSSVDVASAPILVTATTSGPMANVTFASVPSSTTTTGSVSVQSSASTPSGTFAVRTALRFTAGGTAYLLESRGWFTAAQWAAATSGPGGAVDLNVSALGVSGVLPETSVLVSSSSLTTTLYVVLAAGLVLVGVGAWLYFRPKSSSGAR